jgi:hypothetical protein
MVSSVISTCTPVELVVNHRGLLRLQLELLLLQRCRLQQCQLFVEVLGGLDIQSESVGRVNFAEPEVTNTLEPSRAIVIGLLGSDREISASNLPGTSTSPFTRMSALKAALLDVSKSDPLSNTSFPVASILIPRSSVLIGRDERDLDTQFTASVSACCSTVNIHAVALALM